MRLIPIVFAITSRSHRQVSHQHDFTAIQYMMHVTESFINPRSYSAGTTKILANNVSAVTFSLTGDVVTIQLTTSKVSSGRTLTFPLVEKVRVRNG